MTADGHAAKLLKLLKRSTSECASDTVALSGGIDSSAVAYCMGPGGLATAVISRDFVAGDLVYCQAASQEIGLSLDIVWPDIPMLLNAARATISILGNFNDIEIRNSLVPYLALDNAKRRGAKSIITGDGADELFAGYGFLARMSGERLASELERLSKLMRFPSTILGKSMGVEVEAPFLHEDVVSFARGLPTSELTGMRGGKRYGKLVVRRALSGLLSDKIVWREKSPMQDGSGTSGLTGLFQNAMPLEDFHSRQKTILDMDGVTIRTPESLHYYSVFRGMFGAPARSRSECRCPDCGQDARENPRFCRMCGRFPL